MNKKSKILLELKFIMDKGSECSPVTRQDIAEYLEGEGITIHRETLGKDLNMIKECGFDLILCKVGRKNGYFINDSIFTVTEARMLNDIIESSNLLTPKKSEIIIDKVVTNAEKDYIYKYEKYSDCYNPRKQTNEKILYNIDTILESIYS